MTLCRTILFCFLALTPLMAKSSLSPKEKSWLKMVDFIITSDERRTFRKKLQSSYEREKFVRLFWAKRDPDPGEPGNAFKDEYLARYDYVTTHFEVTNKGIPKDERSYIYLLLGKPFKTENRIDILIMGSNYRNEFFQHRPEVWEYRDLEFGYQRKKLRIQLVPTSTFGDFVAVTDNYSTNWIRQIKFKLILNPDMETPPPVTERGSNFQDVVAVKPADEKSTDQANPPTPQPTTPPAQEQNAALPAPASQTAARVPTAMPLEEGPDTRFFTDAGNEGGLVASLGYFKNGPEDFILLGRLGFPLKKLDFAFKKKEYQAPFILEYSLLDGNGKALMGDKVDSAVSLPGLQVLEKKNPYYTREVAVILTPGRYTLRAQLTRPGQARSYLESGLEIRRAGNKNVVTTTDMVLMDPNTSGDQARFNIGGKPFSPRLSQKYKPGERVYPVLEILTNVEPEVLDSVQIHAMAGTTAVHSLVLYPEEMTVTNQKTVLVHPVLRTKGLKTGSYRLRFEMELTSGDLVLAETELEISQAGNKNKSPK